jgi:hypothetical protein
LSASMSDPGLLNRSDDSKKFSLFIMKTFPIGEYSEFVIAVVNLE